MLVLMLMLPFILAHAHTHRQTNQNSVELRGEIKLATHHLPFLAIEQQAFCSEMLSAFPVEFADPDIQIVDVKDSPYVRNHIPAGRAPKLRLPLIQDAENDIMVYTTDYLPFSKR